MSIIEYVKYSEDQLVNWTKPASDTEEQKANNAISMVAEAVGDYDWSRYSLVKPKLLLKGSYKSNTNVRLDSDVDLYVLFESQRYTITSDQDISSNHVGNSGITCDDLRNHVWLALKTRFGDYVAPGNRAFKIHSSTYRVDADVSTFVEAYHEDSPDEGICFKSANDKSFFVNYPNQNHDNGVNKNNATSRNYKKIVRILKNIRNDMQLDTPSFMLESLVYNTPDYFFVDKTILGATTYAQKVCSIMEYLYPLVKDQSGLFFEVNGLKRLFSNKQKWNVSEALNFMTKVYERIDK